ncbi:hypothetical protein F5Y15DRAFT_199329 [Xylariaceae sp. FL0016]|nr:hypothetical protein F5Y15DRAFT_199329 [Xylariaceae sp. FL0016]
MTSAFPQFIQLPPELRLKIWRMSLPRRTYPVRIKLDLNQWNDSTEDDWSLCYYGLPDGAPPALPPVLSVCHEARDELLSNYQTAHSVDISAAIAVVQGEFSDDSVARMCENLRIRGFNPYHDVLQWKESQRWMYPGTEPMSLEPQLFRCICLSVQHVSVLNDLHIIPALGKLIEAVVHGKASSLQTLTIELDMHFGPWKQIRLVRYPRRRDISPVPEGSATASFVFCGVETDRGDDESAWGSGCRDIEVLDLHDPRWDQLIQTSGVKLLDLEVLTKNPCLGLCSPSYGLP